LDLSEEALWLFYGVGVATVIYGIFGWRGWRTLLRIVAALGASILLIVLLIRIAYSVGLL